MSICCDKKKPCTKGAGLHQKNRSKTQNDIFGVLSVEARELCSIILSLNLLVFNLLYDSYKTTTILRVAECVGVSNR